MNRFAELLDRLSYEPSRNNKLRLIADYLRTTEDPDRGWALAALTGVLSFRHAKPSLIRGLVLDRVDPVLFGYSVDYVGDFSETTALMWPADPSRKANRPPTLTEVIETLATLGKIHLPETVANLCFGGQQRNRLYICGSTSLYAVYTSAQGAMKP